MSFVAANPPESVPRLPPPPASTWKGGFENGPVSASIAGRPVRVIVDTAQAGVMISRRLSEQLGLPRQNWTKAFFLPESISPIVRLQDVRISGKSAPIAFAGVVDDDAYDMYVGIDLFRGASIAFGRGRQPEITSSRCLGQNGVPVLTDHGVVRMVGPDIASEQNPHPTTMFAPNATLFDSTYSGPPVFYPQATLGRKMPLVQVAGRTRQYVPAVACDAPRAIDLVYKGKRFGADAPVCAVAAPGVEAPVTYRSAVVGLHSLAARTLLVDLQDDRVCWYN